MIDIEIKICDEKDVEMLEKVIPSSGRSAYHRKRFESQQEGKNTYLIAWIDGKPIGHLNLRFSCPEGTEEYLNDCPELNALHVTAENQSRGTGTKLIRFAEDLAKEKGFDRVCIGVEINNDRARQLYERLGYKDWGHGIISSSWTEIDNSGNEQTKTEKAVYLIKFLR